MSELDTFKAKINLFSKRLKKILIFSKFDIIAGVGISDKPLLTFKIVN